MFIYIEEISLLDTGQLFDRLVELINIFFNLVHHLSQLLGAVEYFDGAREWIVAHFERAFHFECVGSGSEIRFSLVNMSDLPKFCLGIFKVFGNEIHVLVILILVRLHCSFIRLEGYKSRFIG